MQSWRNTLSWLFALTALVCLQGVVSIVLGTIHRHGTIPSFRFALVPLLFTALTVVFGMAWFTVWRKKPSGRWWGLAASTLQILLPFSLIFLSWRVSARLHVHRSSASDAIRLLSDFGLPLLIGIGGIVAFSRRFEQPDPAAGIRKSVRVPGDGTNGLVNSVAQFIFFVVSIGALIWWVRWMRLKAIPENHGDLVGFAWLLLVGLTITTFHELGHTVTGLALGMKLRAFISGPFQWQVREGKWEFQFKPTQILAEGGATAVVPASAGFSATRQIWVTAAGPLVTLLTGGAALLVAFTAPPHSSLQLGGLTALFGMWSIAIGFGNLLPFRTGDVYSDGARIYQLSSKGPWADLQRAFSVVTSSLVTPLRPRDYDLQAIERAEQTFRQGKQALLLRLFAYQYFFDCGKLADAGKALQQAEAIYHESASDIPAHLLTVFVFGNAYVRRDANAAREWWSRMEAKTPTRFNVDYWRACSALLWVEGKPEAANDAWAKSDALAQNLPSAGAYEFDRYCCSQLRRALNEAPVNA